MHVDLLFTFAKFSQYLGVKRLHWSSPVDHETMGEHVSYKPQSENFWILMAKCPQTFSTTDTFECLVYKIRAIQGKWLR